ncbi:hypothetical protein PSTT_00416 [Puccinia striiformis]|uniref:Major facilitator superfamily (MFS) profile domain-containing protein n=1 Tax=Puccinia striiformis TaxID=27350 RepID=A0A2S4W778_9BASI|nr:hypothetical protein PSTT_00416 [Puccinia striiformis]
MSIFKRWRSQSSHDPARQPLLSPGKGPIRSRMDWKSGSTTDDAPALQTSGGTMLYANHRAHLSKFNSSIYQPNARGLARHSRPDQNWLLRWNNHQLSLSLCSCLFALSQLCTICRILAITRFLVGDVVGSYWSKAHPTIRPDRAIGNLPILQSVLAEITDETNKARAFSLIPMCNAVGIIIGPLIGGYLAKPATQYPEYFGKIEFLIDYPYFLPCFIAGMINLLAVIVGFFFLDETLPSKKRTRNLPLDNDSDEDVDDVASETGEIVTEPKPKFSALFTPTVISVLLGSLLVFFQMSSLATLIPLFAYTRFEDGGLGLNLRQMGRHGPYYQRLCRSDCLDGHVPLSAEKMGDDEAFPVGSVNLADGFCALTLGSLVGRGEEGVLRNRSRLQGRYDRLDLRVGGQKLR